MTWPWAIRNESGQYVAGWAEDGPIWTSRACNARKYKRWETATRMVLDSGADLAPWFSKAVNLEGGDHD